MVIATTENCYEYIHTDFTDRLQTYMDFQVFLEMGMHVQAVDTRLLSLLPHSLGTRLDSYLLDSFSRYSGC